MQTDSLALKAELHKAYGIAPECIIGVNIMVALTDYEQLVTSAVEAGAKLIVGNEEIFHNVCNYAGYLYRTWQSDECIVEK